MAQGTLDDSGDDVIQTVLSLLAQANAGRQFSAQERATQYGGLGTLGDLILRILGK